MLERALLSTRGLTKRFGGLVAIKSLDLDIRPCEIHAIIGPNGAGKTTLVSQLVGEITPTVGRIVFAGQDITRLDTVCRCRMGLVRSFQITSVCEDLTVLENVMLAVLGQQRHASRFWSPVSADLPNIELAMASISEAGLTHYANVKSGTLAHGDKRQLEIAIALATKPQLLLLDEPMAGMGREESAAMVALLKRLKGKKTILLIEHDMDAVFALADRISVLVYGERIATGLPAEIRNHPEVRRAYLGESEK